MVRRLVIWLVGAVLVIILQRMTPQYEILTQYSFSSPGHRETTILAVSQTVGPALFESGMNLISWHRTINYDVPSNKIVLMLYGRKSEIDEGKCSAVLIYKRCDGENCPQDEHGRHSPMIQN